MRRGKNNTYGISAIWSYFSYYVATIDEDILRSKFPVNDIWISYEIIRSMTSTAKVSEMSKAILKIIAWGTLRQGTLYMENI